MDGLPPYSILDTAFLADVETAEFALMCRGIRLFIRVCGADLTGSDAHGTSALRTQFLEYMKTANEDFVALAEFENWATRPLDEFMAQTAPADMPDPFTLADYYAPPTYFFNLVNRNGMLVAAQFAGSHADVRTLEPRVRAADLSDVTRSLLEYLQIPHVDASRVTICPDSDPDAWECCETPRTVALPDSPGTLHSFKAALGTGELARELAVHTRCAVAGVAFVPRLVALVAWPGSDGGALMGLVTERVEGALTLADAAPEAAAATRDRWSEEVCAGITELHALGCVWGDAKPENVLVDEQDRLYIVDFQGGWTDGWVDAELAGTRDGDVQGVNRIVEFLGGEASTP